jgi:hypothetical protein
MLRDFIRTKIPTILLRETKIEELEVVRIRKQQWFLNDGVVFSLRGAS